MMVPGLFRLRVAYGKRGRLRYLGHLEVLSTIERCVRRANLPFALSQGFNPRMRVTFTGALPVGCASRQEYYDLYLTAYVPAAVALSALVPATPPDLAPYAAAYVAWEEPALEAFLLRSEWEVSLPSGTVGATEFNDAVAELQREGTLNFMRGSKPKKVDLTRTLVDWEASDTEDGALLKLTTRSVTGTSLRPEILVRKALERCGRPSDAALGVERMAQWGEAEDGTLLGALPQDAATVASTGSIGPLAGA